MFAFGVASHSRSTVEFQDLVDIKVERGRMVDLDDSINIRVFTIPDD